MKEGIAKKEEGRYLVFSQKILYESCICHNVNTHNLKFAIRDRLHILASHWCEAFENLLHTDIAPGRRMIRDFTLKKIKQ